MKETREIGCDVVRDLMPLYVDEVLSKEGAALVEWHVGGCMPCGEELMRLREKVPERPQMVEDITAGQAMKAMGAFVRRRSTLRVIVAVIGMVVLFMALVFAYQALCVETNMPVPVSNLDYAIWRTGDGELMFGYSLYDGRFYGSMMWGGEMEGDEWVIYITPLQPWIVFPGSGTLQPLINLSNADERSPREFADYNHLGFRFEEGVLVSIYDYEGEIPEDERDYYERKYTKIYVGGPHDRVLVWQEGEEVPLVDPAYDQGYTYEWDSMESGEAIGLRRPTSAEPSIAPEDTVAIPRVIVVPGVPEPASE